MNELQAAVEAEVRRCIYRIADKSNFRRKCLDHALTVHTQNTPAECIIDTAKKFEAYLLGETNEPE